MTEMVELLTKLNATRAAISHLRQHIVSHSETDPALSAIAKLRWREQDLGFKIARLEDSGA